MKLFRISPTNPKVEGYMLIKAENQKAAADKWCLALAGCHATPVHNAPDCFTATRTSKTDKTIFQIKVTEEKER